MGFGEMDLEGNEGRQPKVRRAQTESAVDIGNGVIVRRFEGEAPKIVLFEPLKMSKNSAKALPDDVPESYEAALAELEQLVSRLESGQMPLDQLLAGYQRGAALLAFCKSRLQAVEDQIKVLDKGQMQSWEGA